MTVSRHLQLPRRFFMTGWNEVVDTCFAGARRGVGACVRRYLAGAYGSVVAAVLLLSGLAAHAQPAIVEDPQSEIVPPGTVVTMSVVAEGATPLRYYWKFN